MRGLDGRQDAFWIELHERQRLTRGTPTKIVLFNADSRIIAALFTAFGTSKEARLPSFSKVVTKRYKCPRADGLLAVNRVHV